jgi:hypothetical protein
LIHYTKEGRHVKIGLNFRFTRGGFTVIWAWYDFSTNEATSYRFRFRSHIKPRIIREKATWNVVANYLHLQGFVAVQAEVLRDMQVSQRDMMTYNDHQYYVRPSGRSH